MRFQRVVPLTSSRRASARTATGLPHPLERLAVDIPLLLVAGVCDANLDGRSDQGEDGRVSRSDWRAVRRVRRLPVNDLRSSHYGDGTAVVVPRPAKGKHRHLAGAQVLGDDLGKALNPVAGSLILMP